MVSPGLTGIPTPSCSRVAPEQAWVARPGAVSLPSNSFLGVGLCFKAFGRYDAYFWGPGRAPSMISNTWFKGRKACS